MLLSLSLGAIAPVITVLMGVLMVVLRAGASRVYFDVVGTFQADRMLKDAGAMSTTMNALMLDAFSGIEEAGMVLGEPLNRMVDDLVPIAKQVGEATIEFEKFVQEGEDLVAVTAAVISIGEAFGFAADESLNAAARMAQLGGVLGPGMVGPGTEMGMVFGLISGMETEAAMQRMINLQQQTKFMTEGLEDNLTMEERAMKIRANSMNVLDQLNTVENRSAATMSQITYVMNQFAAQAHLTGESIAYMAAMSATLVEAGEEQGKGGRALKMIYARLGANTSGAADALHELGVATKDVDGNLRPLSDIIRDLVLTMEDKTAADKQNIAQLVAGNRHYVRLIKLMENYNRVEQLALEATLALSPAQEEVDRRLRKNITDLRIAEAALYNYQAAIGEAVVPALTEATRRQTDFTVALGELMTGNLGRGVTALVQYIKLLANIAGPMIQATISLNQLNVASQTYRVLTRAIAGDELVREGFLGRYSDDMAALTMQQHALNAVMRGYRMELKAITDNQRFQQIEAIELTETEVKEMEKKLAANALLYASNQSLLMQQVSTRASIVQQIALDALLSEQEQEALVRQLQDHALETKSTNLAYRKGQVTMKMNQMKREKLDLLGMINKLREEEISHVTRSIKKIREANHTREEENRLMRELLAMHYGVKRAAEIMLEIEAEQEAEEIRQQAMKTMQARTALINKFSMVTMASSMALTLFTDGEKSAKTAMVLSTASMIPYLLNMMHSITVTTADAEAKTMNALAADALGVSNLYAAWTEGVLTSAMYAGIAAMMRFIALMGAFAIVAVIIVQVAEWLGVFNTAFKDMDDTISQSVLLEADEIMRIFGLGVKGSTDELERAREELELLDAQITDLEKANRVVPSDLTADQQRAEVAFGNAERGNALAREKIALDEIGIETAKELVKSSLLHPGGMAEATRKTSGFWASVQRGYMTAADASAQSKIVAEQFSYALGENAEAWEHLTSVGLTSIALIDGAAKKLEGIANLERTEGIIGGIGDELQDATDALYDFANAREELFFGFAASNVTGDLVKQVVNKGVETLIANTEIIMTNNFNGMTTREVADEILLQIERRAGSQAGIVISG